MSAEIRYCCHPLECNNSANSIATEKTSQQSIGGSVSLSIVDTIKSLASAARSSSQTSDLRMHAVACVPSLHHPLKNI